jgi:hypothetical protein
LKALGGEPFGVAYGEGPKENRWPQDPKRYALWCFSDRYGQSFWETVATLENVKGRIHDGDVDRVVDLDTGEEVPFTVSVSIGAND